MEFGSAAVGRGREKPGKELRRGGGKMEILTFEEQIWGRVNDLLSGEESAPSELLRGRQVCRGVGGLGAGFWDPPGGGGADARFLRQEGRTRRCACASATETPFGDREMKREGHKRIILVCLLFLCFFLLFFFFLLPTVKTPPEPKLSQLMKRTKRREKKRSLHRFVCLYSPNKKDSATFIPFLCFER